MREVDPWFSRELDRLFGERVRCRWDREKPCFVIEQRVRDQWWHLLDCVDAGGHPLDPGDWTLTYLHQQDMWRQHGGYKAYVHQLEDRIARRKERRDASERDDRMAAAREYFPYVQDGLDGFHTNRQVWQGGVSK